MGSTILKGLERRWYGNGGSLGGDCLQKRREAFESQGKIIASLKGQAQIERKQDISLRYSNQRHPPAELFTSAKS
jgi:hypothetical protein